MGDVVKKNQYINVTHDDKDLVQLAGYHAYNRAYEAGDEIEVNGKIFHVEEKLEEDSTGFEALVIRNITPLTDGGEENPDGELIIVYVGSRPDIKDWQANADLLKDVEPEQMNQAVEYFEEMEEKYGEISAVTGNSLGGALANRVAVDNPHVKSVTLNPAVLPSEFVDADKDYENITNYQINYDLLTRVQDATMGEGRIPGESYVLHSGLPADGAILSNHLGYWEMDENGDFTFEVGVEGEPGHGYIHVGADDHIVTDIWNGEPLHNENSNAAIELNVSDINVLADGIKTNVLERLMLSEQYIKNTKEIVDDESDMFNPRVTELQEKINGLLKEYIADPLYKGASTISSAITTPIEIIISVLDFTEEKLKFLNNVLETAPVEFVESLFSIDISVETIISPMKGVLNKIIEVIEDLLDGIYDLVLIDIPALLEAEFEEEREAFKDAVVDELDAHYSIINEGKGLLISQIEEYEKQVRGVAKVFSDLDEDLGLAIAGKSLPPKSVEVIPEASVQKISQSDFLKMKMSIKDKQISNAVKEFKQALDTRVSVLLSTVKVLALDFKFIVNGGITVLNSLMNVVVYNPMSLGLNLVTDWIENVKEAGDAFEKKLHSLIENVETLITGIDLAMENTSSLIENFEKDIDIAIFAPGGFGDVQLYNIATVSILTEMRMVFEDILRQLSSNRSRAIDGTIDTSTKILMNINLLKYDIEKGTI